jgi:hypothetical protein
MSYFCTLYSAIIDTHAVTYPYPFLPSINITHET